MYHQVHLRIAMHCMTPQLRTRALPHSDDDSVMWTRPRATTQGCSMDRPSRHQNRVMPRILTFSKSVLSDAAPMFVASRAIHHGDTMPQWWYADRRLTLLRRMQLLRLLLYELSPCRLNAAQRE